MFQPDVDIKWIHNFIVNKRKKEVGFLQNSLKAELTLDEKAYDLIADKIKAI